jgi:hypothetical protein
MIADEVINLQVGGGVGQAAYHATEEVSYLTTHAPQLFHLFLGLLGISPGFGDLLNIASSSMTFELLPHTSHVSNIAENLVSLLLWIRFLQLFEGRCEC